MKILVVEDDPDILEFLRDNLRREAFTVDISRDGGDGSYKARVNRYDLIILDYSLPTKNGMAVCDDIRKSGILTPIIFLTVHGEIRNKVQAFDKGVDDYMTKPFSFDELKARIQAITRRPHKIESHILTIGDLRLDTQKQIASVDGINIYLTKKEYNLLEFLMRNRGTVLSRGMIMEHVWSAESDPFSNTVEAHILNIRKKINVSKKKDKDLVRNIPGRGYVMDDI